MVHWHTDDEIRLALDLYTKGATAQEAAAAVDPGSHAAWVAKAARKAGIMRNRSQAASMHNETPGMCYCPSTGYVMARRPGSRKFVQEHRLVWEKSHPGEVIMPGEIIHHINGCRIDNRPENLQKMTVAEHRRLQPRSTYRKGNGIVARVGEIIASRLGVRLRNVNCGPDGDLNGELVEVKTKKAKLRNGWHFLLDKKEADLYLLIGLGEGLKAQAAWLVRAKDLGARKALFLAPDELRRRGVDPWRANRVSLPSVGE